MVKYFIAEFKIKAFLLFMKKKMLIMNTLITYMIVIQDGWQNRELIEIKMNTLMINGSTKTS